MISRRYPPLSDAEVIRVKIDGKNYYQVHMDGVMIDDFKTRPPAVAMAKKLMEDLDESDR